MTLTDEEYEENLYYLVCFYLRGQGETDFNQFQLMKLSNQLAFISTWDYVGITEPTEAQLKEYTLADADGERTRQLNASRAFAAIAIPESQRDDLELVAGCLVFNTDTGLLEVCNGSAWNPV